MHIELVRAPAADMAHVAALREVPELRNLATTAEFLARATGAAAGGGEGGAVRLRPLDARVGVEPVSLDGVACEWLLPPGLDPAARRDGALLYLHGGAFTRGSLTLGRPNAAAIAVAAGLPVLAVGYRQAPAHPFPAATDDVQRAYRALLAAGHAPARMVVVGESSGGCLALGLGCALAGEPALQPAGIAALSPLTDLRLRGASWVYNAPHDVAQRSLGEAALDLYIDAAQRQLPLVSPVEHDFRHSPPLWLGIGSAETMLSDTERTAQRADAAGADVTLVVYEGMLHGFSRIDCPTADRALADLATWCRGRIAADGGLPAV